MPPKKGLSKSQTTGKKGKGTAPNNKKKIIASSQPGPSGVGSVGLSATRPTDPYDAWLTPLLDHLPSVDNSRSTQWLAGTWDSPSASGVDRRQHHSPSPLANTRRDYNPQVSASRRSPAGSLRHNSPPPTTSPENPTLNELVNNDTRSPPLLSDKSRSPSPEISPKIHSPKNANATQETPLLPNSRSPSVLANNSISSSPNTSPQINPPINTNATNETSLSPNTRSQTNVVDTSPSPHVQTNPSNNNIRIPQDPTVEQLLELRRKYHRDLSTLTTAEHHLNFLKNCAEENLIPKGLQIKFAPQIFQAKTSNVNEKIHQILDHAQKLILASILEHFVEFIEKHMSSMENSPKYDDLLNIHSDKLSQLELQQHTAVLRKTHQNIQKKKQYLLETAEKKMQFLRNKDTGTNISRNKQGRSTSRSRTGYHKASSSGTRPRAGTRHFTNKDFHQPGQRNVNSQREGFRMRTNPNRKNNNTASFYGKSYHQTQNIQQPYHRAQTRISQYFPRTQPPPMFPARPPLMPPPWMMGMHSFPQFPPPPPPNPSM